MLDYLLRQRNFSSPDIILLLARAFACSDGKNIKHLRISVHRNYETLGESKSAFEPQFYYVLP